MDGYSKCEARTGTAINHCWHVISLHLVYENEHVCCHCGCKKDVIGGFFGPTYANHGRFSPSSYPASRIPAPAQESSLPEPSLSSPDLVSP